jgi:hypothetical protein
MTTYAAHYRLPAGDPRNLDSVCGTVIFTPAGEGGGYDLGDVIMHRLDMIMETEPRVRAGRHGIYPAGERVFGTSSATWLLRLQEQLPESLQVLFGASIAADNAQNEQVETLLTLGPIAKRRAYPLGYYGLTSVEVRVNGELYFSGDDYTVDYETGTLHVPEFSGLPVGGTMVVKLSAQAVRSNTLLITGPQAKPSLQGRLRITEHDGRLNDYTGGPFVRIIEFDCDLSREDEGDRSCEEFADFTLRAAQRGAGKLLMRTQPEPRAIQPFTALRMGSPLILLGKLTVGEGGRIIIR